MTTFFTSDTHYYHTNIIKFSKRPFKDVEEMNEGLITNYNAVVREKDMVFHLGDFGFGKGNATENILRRLNGDKHLIFGNHDKALRKNKALLAKYFGWAKDYAEIEVEGQKIVLCHYAFRVWRASHYGSYSLYGHSHNSLYDDPNLLSFDVGVDAQNYFPISFEQVKKRMAKKTWKPIDHHGAKEEEE